MGKSKAKSKVSRPYNRNVQVYKSASDGTTAFRKTKLDTSDLLSRDTRPGHKSRRLPGPSHEVTLGDTGETSSALLEKREQEKEKLADSDQYSELTEDGETMQQQDDQPPPTQDGLPIEEPEENVTGDEVIIEIEPLSKDQTEAESAPEENYSGVIIEEPGDIIPGEDTTEDDASNHSPKKNKEKRGMQNISDENSTIITNDLHENNTDPEISVDSNVDWVSEKSEVVMVEDHEDVCPSQLLNGDEAHEASRDSTEISYHLDIEEVEELEENVEDASLSVNGTEGTSSTVDQLSYEENCQDVMEEEEEETGLEPLGKPESTEPPTATPQEEAVKASPEIESHNYLVTRDVSQSFAYNIRSVSSRRPVRNSTFKREISVEKGSVSSRNTSKSSRSGSANDDTLHTDSESSVELNEGNTSVPVKRKAVDDSKTESKKLKVGELSPSQRFLSIVTSPLQLLRSKMSIIPHMCTPVNNDVKEQAINLEKSKVNNVSENDISAPATSGTQESIQNKQSYKSWCNVM